MRVFRDFPIWWWDNRFTVLQISSPSPSDIRYKVVGYALHTCTTHLFCAPDDVREVLALSTLFALFLKISHNFFRAPGKRGSKKRGSNWDFEGKGVQKRGVFRVSGKIPKIPENEVFDVQGFKGNQVREKKWFFGEIFPDFPDFGVFGTIFGVFLGQKLLIL